MGISSSSLNFEAVESTIHERETGLCRIIGYRDSQQTLEKFCHCLRELWNSRGNLATRKDKVPLLCMFASRGQGKTEFCRQIVLHRDHICMTLTGVQKLVVIFVTFHQGSRYKPNLEDKESIDTAVIWRAKKSFGVGNSEYDNSHTDLNPFIKSIREAAGVSNSGCGILFLLDEIMSVPDARRLELLDSILQIQQCELEKNQPTFFFVTSLEYKPIASTVFRLGRPIKVITLSSLEDESAAAIEEKILEFLYSVLCQGEGHQFESKLRHTVELQRMVKVLVSVSGAHYRTLESALTTLYVHLVSDNKHRSARDRELNSAARLLVGSVTEADNSANHLFDKIDSMSSSSFMFDSVVSDIINSCDNEQQTFNQCLHLFLQLLAKPDLRISDTDIQDGLDVGSIVAKMRCAANLRVVPRVCLPFLFMYPSCSTTAYDCYRNNDDDYLLPLSKEPRSLEDWLPLLVHNVGVTVYKVKADEMVASLEHIMSWIELTRMIAFKKYTVPRSSVVTLSQVLPDARVMPWSNERIDCSSHCFDQSFVLNETIIGVTSTDSSVTNMIQRALHSTCTAITVTLDIGRGQHIDYVGRHFEVDSQPVYALCSMHVREAYINLSNLARDIHNEYGHQFSGRQNYYVFIYCCLKRDAIDELTDIPPGTVIVGLDTLQKVFHPFGCFI